jgi:Zn-finger nucleic acid-binding protein
VPSARTASHPPSAPYRNATTVAEPPRITTCPYCSNECPPLVRICPHCDVRLDNVRCARCFTLQPPGTFTCGRCGQALELEPLLDATDAPCPRCSKPLETVGADDVPMHECPRCGGMFVKRDALADILARAEVAGPMSEEPPPVRNRALEEVRYLPCPLCHGSMNRVNFGRLSGVIVDVCKTHGTWFDAGELTRVVAFAAAGGLERTRERERDEHHVEHARSREVSLELAKLEGQETGNRAAMWSRLIWDIFFS